MYAIDICTVCTCVVILYGYQNFMSASQNVGHNKSQKD